jgi:DNA-binding transcriptional ArsR family regulator
VGDDELLSDTLERALFERGCSVHALHEMIEPRNLPQLLRVLNAAGLITIWSSSVTSRDELEQAVKTSGTAAFFAVDKIGTEKQAAVGEICEVLEKEGILVDSNARESEPQRMLERLDRLEAVEAIRQGLQDVEEGRVQDARSALEELRRKLGL